jgi:hypothetical protein
MCLLKCGQCNGYCTSVLTLSAPMMDLLAEPAYIVDILDIEPRPFREMGTILYIRRPPLCIRMEGGVTFLQSFLLLSRHVLQWQDRDILLSAPAVKTKVSRRYSHR